MSLRLLCAVGGGGAGSAEPLLGLPLAKDILRAFPSHPLSALQGVVEFSLCLLFAKLVSYTFLYWLPLYIFNVGKSEGKKRGARGL